MLSYLFIGANDVEASARFYDAVLSPLGYEKDRSEGQYCFSLPETADKSNGPGSIHIAKPFNGQDATAGNGMMPALRADSRAKVDEVHATGIASGGTDEGKPGIREAYTDDFYVAYLRDPVGNKIAVFFSG
jgi:hypothetical protein